MTLKDLIMNQLIKDDEKIRITKPIVGSISLMRGGYWYNDQILDYQNHEIVEYSWSKEKGWAITLAETETELEELPFC